MNISDEAREAADKLPLACAQYRNEIESTIKALLDRVRKEDAETIKEKATQDERLRWQNVQADFVRAIVERHTLRAEAERLKKQQSEIAQCHHLECLRYIKAREDAEAKLDKAIRERDEARDKYNILLQQLNDA